MSRRNRQQRNANAVILACIAVGCLCALSACALSGDAQFKASDIREVAGDSSLSGAGSALEPGARIYLEQTSVDLAQVGESQRAQAASVGQYYRARLDAQLQALGMHIVEGAEQAKYVLVPQVHSLTLTPSGRIPGGVSLSAGGAGLPEFTQAEGQVLPALLTLEVAVAALRPSSKEEVLRVQTHKHRSSFASGGEGEWGDVLSAAEEAAQEAALLLSGKQ